MTNYMLEALCDADAATDMRSVVVVQNTTALRLSHDVETMRGWVVGFAIYGERRTDRVHVVCSAAIDAPDYQWSPIFAPDLDDVETSPHLTSVDNGDGTVRGELPVCSVCQLEISDDGSSWH